MSTYKFTQQSAQFEGSAKTNFPVYVDLTEMATLTQAEADSIRVYSDASLTTELAREIVSTEEMHVKIPTFEAGGEIWVDYDGVRSDYATDATYGAEAVWGDYGGVWHMGDLTSSTIGDSTANSNTGTKGDSTASPTEVSAKIGEGQSFDGNDTIKVNNSASIKDTSTYRVSAWVKASDAGGANQAIGGIYGRSDNQRMWIMQQSGGEDKIRVMVANTGDGSADKVYVSSVAVYDDAYHKVTFTFNEGVLKLYIDGSEDTDVTKDRDDSFSTLHDSTSDLGMGMTWNNTSPEAHLDGILDEFHIQDNVRSGDWETTEYNNQNSPSTFWSVEEVVAVVTATETHTVDTLLLKTSTEEHTVDTLLAGTEEIVHGVDTSLVKDETETHTVDTVIYKQETSEHTTDTVVFHRESEEHTIDTTLVKDATETHTVDTYLWEQDTETHTVDTTLLNEELETHTVDTTLLSEELKTHTVDTNVVKGDIAEHTVDTTLLSEETETHTVDTLITTGNQVFHTVDTLLVTTETATHTVDATLKTVEETTHTVDALIGVRTQTEEHTVDTVTYEVRKSEHTVDTNLNDVETSTHTVDTLLVADSVIKTHTVDTRIKGALEITHTVDTNIKGWAYTGKNTTDDWTYKDKNETTTWTYSDKHVV